MAEGMTAITLKFQADLANLDHQSEKVGEGSNFGFFAVVRNFFRVLTLFLGGLFSPYINLGQGFLIMTLLPCIILSYTMLSFEEPPHEEASPHEGDEAKRQQPVLTFKQKILQILQIVQKPNMKYPLILLLLTFSNPNAAETIMYILTDKEQGGWSFQMYAFNNFIVGVVYATTMITVVSFISKMKFWVMLYVAQVSVCIAMLTNFTLLFASTMPFGWTFAIQVLAGMLYTSASELLLIPIIGRFSTLCPKGLEKFGVTTLATLMVLSATISSSLGGWLLSIFSIKQGSYENFIYPIEIGFGIALFTLAIAPWLIK